MSFVTGLMLIDAPASALNNLGSIPGARTDNTVGVKLIRSWHDISRAETGSSHAGELVATWEKLPSDNFHLPRCIFNSAHMEFAARP